MFAGFNLPKPSEAYDVFRVMMRMCSILDSRGYSLEDNLFPLDGDRYYDYGYLIDDNLTEREKFERFETDYFPEDRVEEPEYDDRKKSPVEKVFWKLKMEFDLYQEAYVPGTNINSILEKKSGATFKVLKVAEANDVLDNNDIKKYIVHFDDPIAIAAKAGVGAVVKITLNDEEGGILYAKVTYPSPITVVVCSKDQVKGLTLKQFGSTVEGKKSKAPVSPKHWILIVDTLVDLSDIRLPPGHSLSVYHYQQLYLNPFEHVKSPPKIRKLSAEEKEELKREVGNKSFPVLRSEDPVAIALNTVPDDIVEIHLNCIHSWQTISSLIYRQVES